MCTWPDKGCNPVFTETAIISRPQFQWNQKKILRFAADSTDTGYISKSEFTGTGYTSISSSSGTRKTSIVSTFAGLKIRVLKYNTYMDFKTWKEYLKYNLCTNPKEKFTISLSSLLGYGREFQTTPSKF